jgi:ligand-binding sensor domain-containing protein
MYYALYCGHLLKYPAIKNGLIKFRYMLSCILCTLFLFIYDSDAQKLVLNSDIRFDNYTGQHNFASNFMKCLTTTEKGYLWVGGTGIYRFDGMQYRHFANFNNQHHGLKDNSIFQLREDRTGRLWASSSGGLCYYNALDDRFVYVNVDSSHKIEWVSGLCLADDKLWFCCNWGLCFLELRNLKVHTTSFSKAVGSYSNVFIDTNRLMICADGNHYIYHVKEDRYETRVLGNSVGFIWDLCVSGGVIWYGTTNGLWRATLDNDTPRVVQGTELFSIMTITLAPKLSGDNIVWLGTEGKGLMSFDISQKKIVYQYLPDAQNPYSISGVDINELHADKQGRLWIATENGVSQVNMANQNFKTRTLPDKQIVKIVQDRFDTSVVWMSCYQRGLIKLDWKTKKVIQEFSENFTGDRMGPVIFNMYQADRLNWLCAGYGDLFVWNEKNGVTKSFDNSSFPKALPEIGIRIHQIIPFNNQYCFITTTGGLYTYTFSTNRIDTLIPKTSYSSEYEKDVFGGEYDAKRLLWLASSDGLSCYDLHNKKLTSYKLDRNIDNNRANSLSDVKIDKRGRIICASKSGIAIFNPETKRFSFIEDFNDVHHPRCYNLKVIDSTAWVNSNAGIISLNLNTDRSFITEFREKGKYADKQFCEIGDQLIAGLKYEYTYFNATDLLKQAIPSSPVLEKIVINNRILYSNQGQSLTLKHDENLVSFYFTAFEYNDPEHIHFRYKLQGADENWTYVQEQREANYIHLPPGDYVFVVEAGNSRGDWNTNELHVSFKIDPPYWQTWWFRILVVCVFIGIVTGIAYEWVRRIKKREAEKTEANRSIAEMEMRSLRSQMNPHFIFNSLNSIQKFIWDNKQEDAAEYLTKFSRLIRMILDNSTHKLIILEDELSSLNLYVELEHRRGNNKFDYQITIEENITTDTILVPPLILQPYVENAIWHGLLAKEGRGVLKITIIRPNEKMLQCVIEDDGIGREKARAIRENKPGKSISYGIKITQQRLEMITMDGRSGNAIIEDLYDEHSNPVGTRVTIEIPVSSFVKI